MTVLFSLMMIDIQTETRSSKNKSYLS